MWFGQAKSGSSIHLIRIREGMRVTESIVPVCKYGQKSGSQKAAFGPGASVTEYTGKKAAEEVITWQIGAGVLRMCPSCNMLLSPGMQSILGTAFGV